MSGRGAAVTLNGEPRALGAAGTVGTLMAELGYVGERAVGVAVAVNGEVVRRGDWTSRRLRAGDAIELVGAVQGG